MTKSTTASNGFRQRSARADGFSRDVVVVGGCGHVGLPLGISFAAAGNRVALYDVNQCAVDMVNAGTLPFTELGANDLLVRALADEHLAAFSDETVISTAEAVVVVIGTPVDDDLNPDPSNVPEAIDAFARSLVPGQLLVLRSTVYPGVTALVEKLIVDRSLAIDVAFCPERIAEGKAMRELWDLPQIVSARTPGAMARATALFSAIAREVIEMTPEEAELAKLFTNAWRYIKFATANQLYMIANDFGVDFEKVRAAVVHNYPRAADMPSPGFAAGPCLFKDTMQLAAFTDHQFSIGNASMLVNEGMPHYLVSCLERRFDLASACVGILGMAFKSESDDIRASLSYTLKEILTHKAAMVLCADPYVTVDPDLTSEEQVLAQADVVIIAAPHRRYAALRTEKPIVDLFNIRGAGVLL